MIIIYINLKLYLFSVASGKSVSSCTLPLPSSMFLHGPIEGDHHRLPGQPTDRPNTVHPAENNVPTPKGQGTTDCPESPKHILSTDLDHRVPIERVNGELRGDNAHRVR